LFQALRVAISGGAGGMNRSSWIVGVRLPGGKPWT
jgi:hypothetical protein